MKVGDYVRRKVEWQNDPEWDNGDAIFKIVDIDGDLIRIHSNKGWRPVRKFDILDIPTINVMPESIKMGDTVTLTYGDRPRGVVRFVEDSWAIVRWNGNAESTPIEVRLLKKVLDNR